MAPGPMRASGSSPSPERLVTSSSPRSTTNSESPLLPSSINVSPACSVIGSACAHSSSSEASGSSAKSGVARSCSMYDIGL